MTLYHLDIGYACFGIVADGDKIVDAAPIARWMIGKTLLEVKPWLKKKGAKGTKVEGAEYLIEKLNLKLCD